jgi:hypothetical protein
MPHQLQATIRVRFTDRTQLERVFPSTDKILSIYAFVRGCLREDVKPIKFILCEVFAPLRCQTYLTPSSFPQDQSPPKRDLKVSDPKVRDLTLAELQLSPSSVLLLRFEDETLNGMYTHHLIGCRILTHGINRLKRRRTPRFVCSLTGYRPTIAPRLRCFSTPQPIKRGAKNSVKDSIK